MDFHYTVKGSWPFPADMLRRDGSRAATADDQAAIDRLTKPYAEDRDAIRNSVIIGLVIPDAGRWRPNTARWRSFGWDVPDDAGYRMIAEEKVRIARMEKLRSSAMSKLTAEEREVLEWFNPPCQA